MIDFAVINQQSNIDGSKGLWEQVEFLLLIFQTGAVFEVPLSPVVHDSSHDK